MPSRSSIKYVLKPLRIHKAGTHWGYETTGKALPGLKEYPIAHHIQQFQGLQGSSSRDAGKPETGANNYLTGCSKTAQRKCLHIDRIVHLTWEADEGRKILKE